MKAYQRASQASYLVLGALAETAGLALVVGSGICKTGAKGCSLPWQTWLLLDETKPRKWDDPFASALSLQHYYWAAYRLPRTRIEREGAQKAKKGCRSDWTVSVASCALWLENQGIATIATGIVADRCPIRHDRLADRGVMSWSSLSHSSKVLAC